MTSLAPGGAMATGMGMGALGPWQNPAADMTLRETMTQNIMQIFAKKRGQQVQQWGQRLGDFVKRLEDQLYATARTKEEYMNLDTLEQRLQLVARSMAPHRTNGAAQNGAPHQQQPQQPALPPGMMPNPGQASLPNAGMSGAGGSMPFPNGGLNHPPSMQNRTSMNGMGQGPGPDMGAHGSMGMPFVPNPAMSQAANGMIPVNNGMHNGMLGMPGGAPGPAGPGMMNGMLPPQGFSNMGVNGFPMPGGPQAAMPGPGQPGAPAPAAPQPGAGMMGAPSGNPGEPMSENSKTQYVQKQQRWLLFLRHCAKCRQSETECQLQAQCKFGKQLWQHILHCAQQSCPYPRCTNSKDLLKHHQKCQSPQCPICAPVKEYVRKTRMQQQAMQNQQPNGAQAPPPPQPPAPPGMLPPGPQAGLAPGMHPGANGMLPNQAGLPGFGPMGGLPLAPLPPPLHPPQPAAGNKRNHNAMANYPQQPPNNLAPMPGAPGGMQRMANGNQPANFMLPPGMQQLPQQQHPEPEVKRIKTEKDPDLGKNTYTSLLETLDRDAIARHKELIYTSSAQQRSSVPTGLGADELCAVCHCSKLLFEPPVLYCSTCGIKIKRAQTYYATPPEADSTQKGLWCHQCYTDSKDKLTLYGAELANVRKSDLLKRKNDEEIDEPWVQCDMCENWVHQICGLFNKGRNNNSTHYLCPDCLIKCEHEGKRSKIEQRPQSMLEGKDLPHCELSKFLENRVLLGLQHERQSRAMKEGKPLHEVHTAENLTIRVVNNVMKKCEVKPRFHDAFQGDRPVSAFPYRQRVILLFQNLDGVDVCLFVMYVQEYGDDCPEPNRNCVYLSYLDSVKYLKPEVTAVLPNSVPGATNANNVALRTFVYHQILIGYLSYVKMLGYTQMYIWACPPMAGDDYILYCHPHKQKIPRSDRLRNWYLDMLRQAKAEGIVLHLSTLWDTYFPGGKDHRLEKCSSVSIPYLEGDYFPGEAENQLTTITENIRQAAKGSAKGGAGVRAAKGKRYGNGPATTDEQLMERLGEILGGNMKDDFIVVHMQEVCTFCRSHVLGGNFIYRYRSITGAALKAPTERKFEGIKLEPGPNIPSAPVSSLSICETCYTEECVRHASGLKPRLPAGVTPNDLSVEKLEQEANQRLKDPDPDMENEFFETRQSFLSLCQGNHYQFDTLRRAKHSSMMVLYHLHNPSEPAFASTCNLCHGEMEAGTGWRCTKCQDFDICDACRNQRGHEHPLVPARSNYDETRMRLTEQERQARSEHLQRTMQLLVHACSCPGNCASTSCRKVQDLFQHAVHCQVKMHGNCVTCKKMWCLLTLHAKSCTQSDCQVPRCKDFKEMRRRQAARQDDKRRKAYQNMLRKQHVLQQQGK